MPTSYLYQINEIVELIVLTDPNSILDVGVGFGKYGFLAREYLDVDKRKRQVGDWKVRIDGIEIHKSYLSPVHSFIYDKIHLGDAMEVLAATDYQYDLLLLIDVIEHFDFERGKQLLEQCLKVSRNIILSTPHDIGTQGEVWGNPHEAHRSQWRRRHFSHIREKFFLTNELSLICYAGADSRKVKRARQRIRLSMHSHRWIPMASSLARYTRRLLSND